MKNKRIKIHFSEKDYKDLAKGIEEWFGISIPAKIMKKFVKELEDEDIILLADIAEHNL